jgi:hypothetical protein
MTGRISDNSGLSSRVGLTKKENFSMLSITWRSTRAMLRLRPRRFIYHVQNIGTTEDGDDNYVLDYVGVMLKLLLIGCIAASWQIEMKGGLMLLLVCLGRSTEH